MLASCSKVTFNVNFVVGDEIYNSISTNGNETLKFPANPTKDGYSFEGWYLDNSKWENPFTANSLLHISLSDDINVYAKFTHKEHSFDSETIVIPTCTDNGYTLKTCECGDTTKTNYVLTIEHTYSDFEVRAEATTYSTGLKERICTVCGFIDKEILPKVTVSFTVTNPDNINSYIGKIDFPNLVPYNQYDFDPLPNTLITEVNLEQNTLIVKAEEIPKDLYGNLENIILDTFSDKDSYIIIDDVDVKLKDIDVLIEDENGDLVAVPWN